MKKLFVLFVLVGGLLFATNFAVGAERLSGEVHLDSLDSPAGGTIGSKISVAVTGHSEEDPAVAFCYDKYLVVYERVGDIYGQLLDMDGELSGSEFKINDDSPYTRPTSDPDVACLWPGVFEQYFIVAYTYDYNGDQTDYDVHVQALTTNGSILTVGTTSVAATGDHELKPSIACEVDDYYCLVAFYYLSGTTTKKIQAQRLEMTAFGLTKKGTVFDIDSAIRTDGVTEYPGPDVTWSKTRAEYMAVWQYFIDATITDYWKDKFVYIWEDHQESASQLKAAPLWLTAGSTYGSDWEFNQEQPKVAFNNLSGNYLVTYTETTYASTSAGVGIVQGGSGRVGDPFHLDGDTNWLSYTAVAFSGGPSGGLNAGDEFLAVNIETPTSLSNLEGAYIIEDELDDHDLPIESVTSPAALINPDVTGNPNDGTYLVVWEEEYTGADSDIYAQRFGNRYTPTDIYLPLVIR